jgi:uncharacterized protein (TIGR00369 family)
VSRIDGRTRRVTDTVELGNPATAIADDRGSLWTATQPTAARHRGGTLTVGTGGFSYPSLEPGAYDVGAWLVLSLVYDGLIAYRRTGGTTFGPLVGNLAVDVPEPSADGRTYVFRLRPGIRFSNGAPLKPEDFRASLEHLLRRHGKALPSFFDAILGARRCERRPRACDLSAGIVTDARERTITIRLDRPDPYLLHKLASPLAYIAPAGHPFAPDREPPGTGPYRIVDFDPDRLVATMPVKGNEQPFGLLHGGATCSLMETIGSWAAMLGAGPEYTAVGIELNASYLRGATSGVVTAVCTPARRGRTLSTFLIEITDEQGRPTAEARLSTFARELREG